MEDGIYLSIVATSRNDTHGGNMLKRMRLFVNGLIQQTNRHKLRAELIIVEWNPDGQIPRLKDILPRPVREDYLVLRYVEVPFEIHKRFKRAEEIPLFQMIAKNVGIRRAKGDFILCTNVDLLFSDPLFELLAARNLRNDTFYRANRCDVPDEIDPQWPFEQQLDWCSRNIVRRIGRDINFKNINLEAVGLGGKSWWKQWIFDKLSVVFKTAWSKEKRRFFQLDTFACGDFTLMSREMWMDLQGYVELDLYSIHIDSLALIAATALGYRQHTFEPRACTYHVIHQTGWETILPLEKLRFLEQRPGIGFDVLYEAGLDMLKHKKRLNLNAENWGFADMALNEIVFPDSVAV